MRIKFIFLLLLFLGNLAARPPVFEHLTVGDGLSHNTVYALLQDHSGMFWIGTRYGLNRYDGHDFQVFTAKDEANPINGASVLSLLEDRRGRIWAGHRDAGISIYDKTTGRFTVFSLGEDGRYPVDWKTITVRALFLDSRGYTWIGTFGGGVIVLDEKGNLLHHLSTYTNSVFAGKISNDFIFDFAEDKAGNVYVAASGKGLNVVSLAERKVTVLHAPDKADLASFDKALCVAKNGDVWVATSGNGAYRYSPDSGKWRQYQATQGISHPFVSDVAEDAQGKIWLTTDGGGLNVIDPVNGHQENYVYSATRKSSLNTNALYCLFFDLADNLWVGTFNGGVNLHRSIQPPFVTERRYDLERELGLRSVLALAKDEKGKTWLGTDGGGLFYFQDKWNQVVRYEGAKKASQQTQIDRVVTALAVTPEQNLWFGSYAGGLGYVNVKTGEVTKYRHSDNPQSLAHDNVWDLAIDSAGGVWIGLLGGGLDYLAPGATEFTHFKPDDNDDQSISGFLVVDVLLDQNNRHLWVATENAGLNRLDLHTGKFLRFRHNPADKTSISSDRISHLYQDQQGGIWVGTEYNGLDFIELRDDSDLKSRSIPGAINEQHLNFIEANSKSKARLNKEAVKEKKLRGANQATSYQIIHYNRKNGYPFEMVNGIEIDAAGHVWVSGLSSIIRWNRNDNSFLELSPEEELGYNLYNPGAIQKLTDGKLVFGGVNGFSVIEPSLVTPVATSPDVLIADFRLANRPVSPGDNEGRTILTGDINDEQTKVHLSYQDRGIAFQFAAPAYPAPDEVRYAFMLEGFDQDWNYNELGERSAYYSSLKGGTYKLRVMATGGDDNWGAEMSPLTIIVKPPFWRTRWFVISMVALAFALIYLLNRYLLNRQRELYQQQVLLREQEILQLRNKNLKEEVINKQSELGASLLQMAHKNEFLNDLKNKIQQLNAKETADPSKSLRSVVRVINNELKQEDYWEQFQLIFDQSYKDFVNRLRQHHPDLSINDSRLSCFIRMQLNNREIASVLNITLNGVEQAKYRLKKKMGLPKEQNLNQYIESFG